MKSPWKLLHFACMGASMLCGYALILLFAFDLPQTVLLGLSVGLMGLSGSLLGRHELEPWRELAYVEAEVISDLVAYNEWQEILKGNDYY